MTMPEFEPVAYGVLEGRDIKSCDFGYIAAWHQACHEHINEAIAEHNIEGASTWKAVEFFTQDQLFFTQDQLKQAYAAGQAELIAANMQVEKAELDLSNSVLDKLELVKELAISQADNERLREALSLVESVYRLNVVEEGEPSSVLEAIQKALSTQPDNSALREHDAKLVERIASEAPTPAIFEWISKFADKIRDGKF